MPANDEKYTAPGTAAAAADRPLVYVINTDPSFLEMIAELLADTRVRIQLEQMGGDARATADRIRAARPDLVILDVVPTRGDAAELLDLFESDRQLARLAIMLASTSAGLAEQLADRHAGLVRDVLPKPFELDDFYAKLAQLVRGARVP